MKKTAILIIFLFSFQLFSQEVIKSNPSFINEFNGWNYGVNLDNHDFHVQDAAFSIVKESNDNDGASCKVKVKISTTSENLNDVYLQNKSIELKKNKIYRICFYVKSDFLKDKVQVSIGSGELSNARYLTTREQKFIGDGSWKKISFTFKVTKDKKGLDYDNLFFMIGFNHRFGEFYVDDFSMNRI